MSHRPSRATTIAEMKAQLANKMDKVRELELQNESLRARMAVLQLTIRMLHEVREHAATARHLEPEHEEVLVVFQALEESLKHEMDSLEQDLVKLAGSGAGAPMSSTSNSSGGSSYTCAGSSGHGRSADHHSLLQGLTPHLQAGKSLLHLDSLDPGGIQAFQRMVNTPELMQNWGNLIRQARPLVTMATTSAEGAAAVYKIGVLLKRTYAAMVFWAFEGYMKISSTNLECLMAASGTEDAPLSHWEHVLGTASFTRMQALMSVNMYKVQSVQLARCYEERAGLTQQLKAQTESVAAEDGSVFAVEYAHQADEEQSAAVAAVTQNISKQRAVMMINALCTGALISPTQFARLLVSAYPWPIHYQRCNMLLESWLKLDPQRFTVNMNFE